MNVILGSRQAGRKGPVEREEGGVISPIFFVIILSIWSRSTPNEHHHILAAGTLVACLGAVVVCAYVTHSLCQRSIFAKRFYELSFMVLIY